MLGRLCRVGGTARRAALSLGSASPHLDASPAAARRTMRGDEEKKPEEALPSSRSALLPATPAAGAAARHTVCAEAAKKPEASPNHRRAALAFATSLSPLLAATPAAGAAARRTIYTEPEKIPLLAATPAAAAAARRTIYTEPEKIPADLTPNQMWLYRQISDLRWDSAMELHKMQGEMMKLYLDERITCCA
jgi:hypothetical protein